MTATPFTTVIVNEKVVYSGRLAYLGYFALTVTLMSILPLFPAARSIADALKCRTLFSSPSPLSVSNHTRSGLSVVNENAS